MSNGNNKNETPKEVDPIHARLDEIENGLKQTIEKQNETIEKQSKTIEELKVNQESNRRSNDDDDDEGILVDRQSAHTMRLPVVEGAPAISGKLERIFGVPGLEYVMKITTAALDEDKKNKVYTFPYGCDMSRLDFNDERLKGFQTVSFENIQGKDFKLQNTDENDLTGASSVKKGQIVGEGKTISEVDRSEGRPVRTGRKLRTVVRRDARSYTIEFEGELITLSNEDLNNIRI